MIKLCFLLFISIYIPAVFAQQAIVREDAIWARNTSEEITLDGVLNESSWAKAESIMVVYGQMDLLPTSGWRAEFQAEAVTDPTHATVKFLAKGNELYLAFIIPDSSIVGSRDWARWDGILMCIKDRKNANRPIPPLEYFYTYWYDGLPNGQVPVPGDKPMFRGAFTTAGTMERTPEQVAKWDAGTHLQGSVNDGITDTGFVVEMRIALDSVGYDATGPNGDIAELNFSIWDCDYSDQGVASRISTTRTHWQSPWNATANNVGSVYIRPDVTVNSGALPRIEPDVIVPNAESFADPVIDGNLNDELWSDAYEFDIAWGNSTLRNLYPGVGPYQSGQYQPDLDNDINTPLPQILDPSYGRFFMAVKGNFLYLSADVDDQLVQGTSSDNTYDAVRFTLGDRLAKNEENAMTFRPLTVSFGADGNVAPLDYLPVLVDTGGVEYSVMLKGTTTVNNNTDVDQGYTVEMKVDLTKIGYPDGLGDRLLFAGAMLSDGDSFDDPANNYGTRTWIFREHAGGPAAAYMYLADQAVGVEGENSVIPSSLELYGNYPNPFNPETNIKYNLPSEGNVNIIIYNALGQELKNLTFTNQQAGVNNYKFNASQFSSGVYLYKIHFTSLANKLTDSKIGKMILMK